MSDGECIHGTCFNETVSERYCWEHLDLDIILQNALEKGATVELQLAQEYGYEFVIDGVKILDSLKYDGQGLPHESLEGAFGFENVTDEAKQKIRSILDSSQKGESGG